MIPIIIKMEWDQPPGVSKRHYERVVRPAAHLAMGKFWHSKLLPKHFTRRARVTYKHRSRNAVDAKGKRAPDGNSYIAQKMRAAQSGRPYRATGLTVKQAGRVDNVLTGNLKRLVTKNASIRAFPSRVTITVPVPVYAPMKPRDSRQPNKMAEIFSNTDSDVAKMAKVLETEVARGIRNYRNKQKIEA